MNTPRMPCPGGSLFLTLVWSVLLALIARPAAAQNLSEFEDRVTEFRLKNGLHFLVLERHQSPVLSFHTYADVGAVDEVKGITGMAHVFEHMAFKGSTTVGTTDYQREVEAMAKVDQIFANLKIERRKGEEADRVRLARLEEEFRKAQEAAASYSVPDEFEGAFIRAGANGLNASTSYDATRYTVSLPSNKMELWMSLESDRFLKPVLREFYREKAVVMEERRLRTENQPVGRLIEEFLALAYKAHPYGEPVVGHMSDLETMTRGEARLFFEKYYSPANLTVAIVGDVDPREAQRMAELYFGRIAAAPKPDPVETVEPPQAGERRVLIEDPAQPFVLMGYHKPDINHPDHAVFEVIIDILGIGKTSRLYRGLVRDQRLAVAASAFQGLPGDKYPGLFLFYTVPAQGHTAQQCETALEAEIERLRQEPVAESELKKAKTRQRAGLIRSLASNSGLAGRLTFYQGVTGDWRNLFGTLEKIDRVTADDVQRVARQYFTRRNLTVGLLVSTSGPEGGGS